MIAGILAAGRGERLRQGGVATPKPFVEIAGLPLVCHALAAVAACGAEHAVVAVNEETAEEVGRILSGEATAIPVTIIVRTTASSLETFSLVADTILRIDPRGPAVIAMVDGVFSKEGLDRFAHEVRREVRFSDKARASDETGLIAVTDLVDDERPLRVSFDAGAVINAIGAAAGSSSYATAGLYLLPASVLERAEAALQQGQPALRDFLAGLPGAGVRLRAVDIGSMVDVDVTSDIARAEWLAAGGREG